jgi:uncharacterized membrane protein
MSNVGEIESVLFKRVAGGHIFQAPNPWIFGRGSRYLVNDTQKAQLLAIITPRRPMLRVAVITAGIALWAVAVAALVWAFGADQEQPTGPEMITMALLTVVPMFLALMLALKRNLRRMAPVLAGAPRTDERISRSEIRQAMAKTMSFRATLLVGAAWVAILLLQIYNLVMGSTRHPLFSDAQSFLNLFLVITAAGLAAHYLVIAMRKARSKKETT